MSFVTPQWRSQTSINVPEEKSRVVTDFAVDAEGQGLYAITGGLDANLFELDPITGELSFKDNPPDFEDPLDNGENNVYNLTVQFTDIRNAVVSRDITVIVSSRNDTPVITSDGGGENAIINVNENTTAVTDVNAIDIDLVRDAENLVVNGSFEEDFRSFVPTIQGWTGINGTVIELANPSHYLITGQSGNVVAEIDSNRDGGSGIFQNIQTEDGQKYRLSVDIAARAHVNGPDNTVEVWWRGERIASIDPTSTRLTTYTFDVVGSGGTDQLSFRENAIYDNALGGVIDNVQLNALNPSAPDDLTYSISGGDDADAFTINETTGELSFKVAPDFENPSDQNGDNMFDVDVKVTDSGGFDPASLNGRRFAKFGGNYYVASTHKSTWADAQAEAQSLGGNLVIIDSAAVKTFIQQTFADLSTVWTGLQDIDGDNQVSNIDGSDIVYNFFDQLSVILPPGAKSILEALQNQFHGSSAVALHNLLPNAIRGFSFNPNTALNYVIEIDPDSAEFQNSETQTLKINVINQQANAVNDTVTTPRETPIEIDVLENDTSSEGVVLQLDGIGRQPINGSVVVNDDGTITYTPNDGFSGGRDTFTYEISDGLGEVGEATVTINVTTRNTAPEATDDRVTTAEDTPITINVRANDEDINNDNISLQSVGDPNNGTAQIVNGQVVYNPDQDFNGIDIFTYRISDGKGGQDTGEIRVNVTPVNDNPIAVEEVRNIERDQTIVFNPVTNDTDVDGDTISLTQLTSAPTKGAAFISQGGNVVYDPNPNATGEDSFTYEISDGNGGTDIGTVTINIGEPALDTDGDGVPDIRDLDDDNDGISDQIEDSVGGRDSDGDGVFNRLDLDSDNDGINDVNEAGPLIDNNGDGFADGVDNNGDGIIDNAPNQIIDTDNDGVVDHSDLDSDNDTISDLVESGDPDAVDQNDDGVVDGPDSDGDGIQDSADDRPAAFGDNNRINDRPTDTDGDGVIDSRDIDSDDPTQAAPGTGDGIGDDIGNAGNSALDPNQDGTIDNPADRDGDGIANGVDDKPTAFGGLGAPNPPQGNLSISGQVRNDLDGDGNLNDPDPGIGGIRINLFADFNNDGSEDRGGPVATATTANDGTYRFDNLDAGSYIVREVDPAGAVSTADSNGGNPNRVTNVIVSNANPIAPNVVFLDSFPGGGNDDPIAVDDNATTREGVPVNINVLTNDSDPNSDNLTITNVSDPANGTVVIQNGQVRYVPDANYTGVDIFDYTISDGNGGTDNAQVRITVNPDTGNGKLDIFGTNRNDTLRGSRAAENIYGQSGQDLINAGDGADCLFGQNGNDTLQGMAGNDTLEGDAGSDLLLGGGGRDVLVGQQATQPGVNEVDRMIGGAGSDIFVLGDADTFYYDIGGDRDYAKIEDFNAGDKLQLKGEADDYTTQGIGNNLYLYCKGDGALKPDELIAILNDVDSLNLSGDQVTYV